MAEHILTMAARGFISAPAALDRGIWQHFPSYLSNFELVRLIRLHLPARTLEVTGAPSDRQVAHQYRLGW